MKIPFLALVLFDLWRKSEIDNVRHVAKRYIGKSDPYIVMVSTPIAHGSLFYVLITQDRQYHNYSDNIIIK